jgi:hypothetical protein
MTARDCDVRTIAAAVAVVFLVFARPARPQVGTTVTPPPKRPSPSGCLSRLRRSLAAQREALQPLAAADLDPRKLALIDLRRILINPGTIAIGGPRNARTVKWLTGPGHEDEEVARCQKGWFSESEVVSAVFRTVDGQLGDYASPIDLSARAPFPGSMLGIRFGEPVSRLTALARPLIRNRSPSLSSRCSIDRSIELDDVWVVCWTADRDDRLTSMRIYDSRLFVDYRRQ